MLDWQQTKTSTGKLGRIVFNPLEKVFPRKNTEPGVRLKTSSDFKTKMSMEKPQVGLTSFESHPTIKNSVPRGLRATPDHNSSMKRDGSAGKFAQHNFKLGHGMPLSAKNAANTPIKIFVNIGDTSASRVKKVGLSKEQNKSKDKDISVFLVKKPSAGIINLKLSKQPGETRGFSFDQEPKNSTNLPLDLSRARRNSSRAIEKANEILMPQKLKPYIGAEMFSSGKRKLDSGSNRKSKTKLGSGTIGVETEKENQRKGTSSTSKSKIGLAGNSSYKTSHFQASIEKPALTSIVTQVNEEDMNKLGDVYAHDSHELTTEEFKAEQSHLAKKFTKKDYFQAKLPYYTGGVVLFFHDPKKDYFATLYKEHFRHTFASLKFCKGIIPLTSSELALKQRHYPKKASGMNKRSLVLDLDETLIHCVTAMGQSADIYLPIKFPSGDTVKAPINVRPFAVKFLEQMSKLFEVFVFTASNSCYADVVLDYLDPERKMISHRLYRESCVQIPNGMFIKDLRVIGGRDIENMVLVDNASYSFGLQLDQGVPIVPFYDSKQDIELLTLGKYLEKLATSRSMGEMNKKTLKLREISDCFSVEDAYKLFVK